MKLSDIAARMGVPIETLLDELEIDGAGKFSELSANAGRATQLESVLMAKQNELAQYEQYIRQVQQQGQQAAAVQGGQPEWYTDPILAPIAQDYQRLREEVTAIQEKKISALANGLVSFMGQAQQWANQQETRYLKSQHADFDEERITKFARDKGMNDTWENVYLAEKASRLPDIIKEESRKAREEGAKQASSRGPVQTEMGSVAPGASPASKEVTYEGAFGKMREELSTLGMGGWH